MLLAERIIPLGIMGCHKAGSIDRACYFTKLLKTRNFQQRGVYILMVAFSLAGLYVGSVSALKRLGVYKAKDQRSE